MAALILAAVPPAFAHPGGLDANGCHHDRRNGGYHCHRSPRAPTPSPTPAPRPAPVTIPPAPVAPPDSAVVPAPLLATPPSESGLQRPITGNATVLDGDTLDISGQRIRLWGIDAFEAEQLCRTADGGQQRCGAAATHHLTALAAGAALVCAPRDRDAYGRIVAVCRVGSTDLSADLVRNGLAVAFRRYALDYVPDEDAARLSRVGAWAGGFVDPSDFRRTGNGDVADAQRQPAWSGDNCAIRGNINRAGERIYHMPGDPFYNRTNPEAVFCTEAEAQAAGFRRAGRPR